MPPKICMDKEFHDDFSTDSTSTSISDSSIFETSTSDPEDEYGGSVFDVDPFEFLSEKKAHEMAKKHAYDVWGPMLECDNNAMEMKVLSGNNNEGALLEEPSSDV